MRVIGRKLSWTLALALVLQLAGAAAPVVFSAGLDVAELCTCPGGTHGTTCPMHHGNNDAPADQTGRCVMRSGASPTDLALLTLTGSTGTLPTVISFDVTLSSSAARPGRTPNLLSRTDLPDPPPPRS